MHNSRPKPPAARRKENAAFDFFSSTFFADGTHTTPAQRRIRRERLSAAKRGLALAMRSAGATQAQIAAALALSPARIAQILAKAEHLAARPHWHGQFPARALNFLIGRDLPERPEIEAAEALARLSRKEIQAEPNLGRGAVKAIEVWLAGHGLTLRDETPTGTNGDSVMTLAP